MSSISGLGQSYSQYANMQSTNGAGRGRSPQDMFKKVDTDGSGGVDATELDTMLSKVASKTGTEISTSAEDLLTSGDTDGDGSLSSSELDAVMKSVMPPPSTMDFARGRSAESSAQGSAGDDLFSKVDADSSGTISQAELQDLMDTMSETGDANATAASDMITKLDSDGDGELSQTEFDAGRPQGGPGAMGGMPPPPPSASAGTFSSDSSTTYDSADTNKDGVVSAAEQAAADALSQLFDSADADSDGKLSKAELSSFIQQLANQYAQMASGEYSSSTGSTVNAVA